LLCLTHFAGVAGNYLNAASRAARISATAMQDVHAVIFEAENEFSAGFTIKYNSSICRFSFYLSHQ
jgi:hypothetical protein